MRFNFPNRTSAMIGAFGLALVPVSGIAAPMVQEEAAPSPDGSEPTPDQKASMAQWPEDMRLSYSTWPEDTKAYYWTLNDARQKMFWGLADPDKVTLSRMTPEDQEKTWTRIEGRTAPKAE